MNNSTNNNNRWLTIITLFLLTANIATLAFLWMHHKTARRDDDKLPPPNGQVFEFINTELKLDSAQRETYRKLREEHQAGVRPLQDSIRKAKDDLYSLLKQPNVDESTLQAAAKKAAEADQQLDIFTFRHFQKLRAICTPAQQQKFDSIIQDVLHRMAPAKRQGPPPPRREGEEGPGRMPPPPPGDRNEEGPPPDQK